RWRHGAPSSARRAKMLGQLQRLALVVGADPLAVEPLRTGRHVLVDEAADGLAVLDDEGHLVRAYLKHGPRAFATGTLSARGGMPEAGIEEAGVVHPEFPDKRVERHHLRGIERRHVHGLAADQDVELVGI